MTASGRRRVLVIDDDRDFALSLADILEARGYEAILAHDVKTAETEQADVGATVALIDVRLAGEGGGFTLLTTLRARYPRVLCVMMTAHADTENAVRAIHEGAYDFLRKPFGPAELLAVLDRCFAHARLDADKEAAEEALRERNAELAEVNAKLTTAVGRLEERDRRNALLNQMGGLLQATRELCDIPVIVASSMGRLFPGVEGELYLRGAQGHDLECVASWPEGAERTGPSLLQSEDCWGLRLVRLYAAGALGDAPLCAHIANRPKSDSLCVPLVAESEVLGLLHLRDPQTGAVTVVAGSHNTVASLGEMLSLAIANIALREHLSRQAIRDSLTGLYNRRFLEESLEREIRRAARDRSEISVLMLDVDHFKRFNDTHGHAAGDRILRELGRLLMDTTRGGDVACRYGGEEFTVFLPGCSSEKAQRRAKELCTHLEALRVSHRGRQLEPPTISVGIATYPSHGATAERLLSVADKALYRAKAAGRNRVRAS